MAYEKGTPNKKGYMTNHVTLCFYCHFLVPTIRIERIT